MARYRKIDPRIWNDEKFRSLSDKAKFLTLFLLTHPYMTALGAMRHSIQGIVAELGWDCEGFPEGFHEGFLEGSHEGSEEGAWKVYGKRSKGGTKAFEEVFKVGIARYDETACLVWLPNFLKYNKPESPNVIRAWKSGAETLPECGLYYELIQESKVFAEGLGKGFDKAFREAFGKPSPKPSPKPSRKTMPNPDPEPEPYLEPEPLREKNSSASPQSRAFSEKPHDRHAPPKPKNRFEEFWQQYPHGHRKAKKLCMEIWQRKKLDDKAEEILRDLTARPEQDSQWVNGYIPNPTTYLNQERWGDDYRKTKPAASEGATWESVSERAERMAADRRRRLQ